MLIPVTYKYSLRLLPLLCADTVVMLVCGVSFFGAVEGGGWSHSYLFDFKFFARGYGGALVGLLLAPVR